VAQARARGSRACNLVETSWQDLTKMGKGRSTFSRFKGLSWTAPSKALPHGLTGVVSLLSGFVLIVGSLAGSFAAVESPLLLIYVASTMANALAGYFMSGRAPRTFQVVFEHAALQQICLVYFAWRFSSYSRAVPTLLVRPLDGLFGVGILFAIGSFVVSSVRLFPPLLAAPVMAGSFALLLLSGYPLQLAYEGDDWWQCVQGSYPMQSVGMVGYIYVPATWTFGVMLFGATLLSRKIISDTTFCSVFLGLVLATLFATVLLQEVHIPVVSTQKLYLPCPAPPPGSWQAEMASRLDTSVLAQTVLALLRTTPGLLR